MNFPATVLLRFYAVGLNFLEYQVQEMKFIVLKRYSVIEAKYIAVFRLVPYEANELKYSHIYFFLLF
jgi:hypothetical protein